MLSVSDIDRFSAAVTSAKPRRKKDRIISVDFLIYAISVVSGFIPESYSFKLKLLIFFFISPDNIPDAIAQASAPASNTSLIF